MYSVAQAAKLIGVTRTTVYKYINKDRKRYVSDDSKQLMLSDAGITQLRLDLAETVKQPTESDGKTIVSDDKTSAYKSEIERLTARIELLEMQHDNDQQMIQLLTETVNKTQRALDQEQQLRLHELNKPNWIKRLFSK